MKAYAEGILADAELRAARESLAPFAVLPAEDPAPLAATDFAEAIVAAPRTILTGPPGAGKTAILQAVLYDYARYILSDDPSHLAADILCEERRIPVYLDLGALRRGDGMEELVALSLARYLPRAGLDEALSDLSGGLPVLLLSDHLDRLWEAYQLDDVPRILAFIRKDVPSRQHLVAVRDHDLPLLQSWLLPAARMTVAPLSEDQAFAHLAIAFGEAKALDVFRFITAHRLWDLADNPLMLKELAKLPQASANAAPSRLDFAVKLADAISGARAAGLRQALGEIALAAKRDPAEAIAMPEARRLVERSVPWERARIDIDHLVRAGLLRYTDGRKALSYSTSLFLDFLAAIGLEATLARGRRLASELAPPIHRWSDALIFLYGLTRDRRGLLTQLLTDADYDNIFIAARCVTESEPQPSWRALLHPHLGDPRLHLLLARAFRELGYLPEAQQELEEALRFSPDRADVRQELARALGESGRHHAAIAEYERLLATAPGLNWQVDAALERAKAGQTEQALAELSQGAQEMARGQARALAALADLKAGAGHAHEALFSLREAIRLTPEPAYRCQLANLLEKVGRRDEAIEELRRAVEARPDSGQAHVALGMMLQQEGRLSDALEELRAAIRAEPDNSEAHLHLARCCRIAGQHQRATLEATKALALRPAYAAAQAEVGLALIGEGRMEEGVAALRAACDMEPNNAEFHHHLGWAAKQMGSLDRAEAELRLALQSRSEDADWHGELGALLMEAGRLGEAAREYERTADLAPQSAWHQRSLGVVYGRLGEDEKALAAFSRALTLCADSASAMDPLLAAEIHNERGQLFSRQGQHEEALREFRLATELMPHQLDYRMQEGQAYGYLGQPHLMLSVLQRAVEMQPDDALARFRLAQAYEALWWYDDASAEYRRAVELAPEEAPFRKQLGKLLRQLGRLDEALESLRIAIRLRPEEADGHHQLALALEDAGEPLAAMAEHRAAARLSVNDPVYWLGVGRAARKATLHGEAQIALRAAISLGGGSAAYAELAQLLDDQGRTEEALAEAHQAIAQEPKDGSRYRLASQLLAKLGRRQEALAQLEKALTLEPQRAEWKREVGQLLEEDGRRQEALAAYQEAVALDPRKAIYHWECARLYQEIGNREAALDALERAVECDPAWPQPRLHLADALLSEGRAEEALGHAEAILAADSRNADALALAGTALHRLSRLEEAAIRFREAVALRPESGEWRVRLGEALLALRRPEEALAELQKALDLGEAARWALARACHELGRNEEAAQQLDVLISARKDAPDRERGAWQALLGEARLASGLWQEAEAAFLAALNLGVDSPATRRMLGTALQQQGKHDAAVAELKRSLASGLREPSVLLTISRSLAALGELDAALAYAQEAALAEPGASEHRRQVGAVLRQMGDRRAIGWLEELVTQGEADAAVWDELGLAHEALGDSERAREAFERAVALAPNEDIYHLNLGRWYAAAGRYDDAIPELLAAQGAGNGAELHHLLGQALEAAGRHQEALVEYEKAITIAPDSGEGHFHAGILKRKMGLQQEAFESLKEAVRLQPDESAWQRALAEAHLAAGDREGALTAYLKLTELQPRNPDFLFQAGHLLNESARFREAVSRLERAVRLKPKESSWQAELGKALAATGDPAGAQVAYAEAVSLAPKVIGYRVQLAACLRAQGEMEPARAELEAAIAASGDSAEAHYQLGLLQRDEQRFDRALAEMETAIRLAPNELRYRQALVEILNVLGRREEALAQLAAITKADNVSAEALAAAGRLYELMGSDMDALGCYRRALELRYNAGYHIDCGRVLRKLGRLQEALAAVRRAIAEEGRAAWYAELGLLLEQTGEEARALDAYQRAAALEPHQAVYHFRTGALLERMEKHQAAKEELEKAVRLRKDYPEALRHLSAVLAKLTMERGGVPPRAKS
ncbi:MAG: tetratricopeptide repeat protein [Chloroflexi bacterium]|nr:tetratricopeptide repeat protein [Chloroflexota bacterium]